MLTPISVVIPLHNRADLASPCLASLARWTTPLEILVVDDGSTDPGVELLRRAGLAHQWLRHPQALGFSAAVNRGLAQATGDPLLLLNSDAEVTEGGDHALRAALTEDSGGVGGTGAVGAVGAVAARLVYPDGRPQWSGGAFPSLLWLFALASGLGRGARFRAAPGAAEAGLTAALSTGPRAPPWRYRAPPGAPSGRSTRPTATMPRISTTANAWRLPAAACASSPTGSSCTTWGARSARGGQASGAEGRASSICSGSTCCTGRAGIAAQRGRAGHAPRSSREGVCACCASRGGAAAARRSPSRPPSGPSQATAAAQGSAKPPTNDSGGIEWRIDGLRLPLLGPRLRARAS